MKPCFPSVPFEGVSESPVKYWLHEYRDTRLDFTDSQKTALSRLLPLLVCGEQSSQWVFYNESQRELPDSLASARDDFERIVADEQYHEDALELVQSQLELPKDVIAIKRRSQRFFASLGSRKTFEEHFAQIACLDALVCKIMLYLEKGRLDPHHPFVLLCRSIKQDEARHVTAARQHALALGYDRSEWKALNTLISEKLYKLLNSEREAFEELGITIEHIFDSRES